jgi:hypothetical protein
MGSNPALQYISSVEQDSADNTYITHNKHETDNKQTADNTQYADNTYKTDNTYVTPIAHITHDTQEKHNKHNTYDAYNKERKSRRLNLLLQPSLLDNAAKIARMKQTSVNDLINSVLRSYIEHESAVIERYEEVFGKDSREGK